MEKIEDKYKSLKGRLLDLLRKVGGDSDDDVDGDDDDDYDDEAPAEYFFHIPLNFLTTHK